MRDSIVVFALALGLFIVAGEMSGSGDGPVASADLRGVDRPGGNLPGVELPGGNLPGVELPGVELSGVDVPGAALDAARAQIAVPGDVARSEGPGNPSPAEIPQDTIR